MATALHSNSILTMGGSRSPCSRHIRFAPLPDPRRSVLITDEGNELPVFQHPAATQFPAPPTPSPTDNDDYFNSSDSESSSSTLSSLPSSSLSSTPGTATPSSPYNSVPSPESVSSKLSSLASSKGQKSKVSSFFKGFKLGSGSNTSLPPDPTYSLTPVPSNQPPSEAAIRTTHNPRPRPTIPHIYSSMPLCRTSYPDGEPGPTSASLELSRWPSEGPPREGTRAFWGVPLGRVSSTQSYQSKSKSPLSPSQRPAYGRRMPNGRVYGQNRQRQEKQQRNLFDNIPDADPKFNMWGYGGMGSIRNVTTAELASRWQGLYGQGGSALQPTVESDDDDGDGMAWVRKRRAERKREAELVKNKATLEHNIAVLEKVEQREQREREQELGDKPTPTTGSEVRPPPSGAPVITTTSTEEHVTRAVNIPAPHRYHRRDEVSEAVETTVEMKHRSSESESESDVEREEEEEDEGKTEANRKTSLGAGVEKISRHQ